MSKMQDDRLPYWEYMRISEPEEVSFNNLEMSALIGELSLRVKKLEEEIAWLRKGDSILTGTGAMD
jgi:hypothetical protein